MQRNILISYLIERIYTPSLVDFFSFIFRMCRVCLKTPAALGVGEDQEAEDLRIKPLACVRECTPSSRGVKRQEIDRQRSSPSCHHTIKLPWIKSNASHRIVFNTDTLLVKRVTCTVLCRYAFPLVCQKFSANVNAQ